MTWRPYDEPREVDVLHDDGRWYRGLASGWTFADSGWRCHVEYSVAVGSKNLRAVDPDAVREITPF